MRGYLAPSPEWHVSLKGVRLFSKSISFHNFR
jgi:hypothetical protein